MKGFKHRDNSSKKRLIHTEPFFIFCKKMGYNIKAQKVCCHSLEVVKKETKPFKNLVFIIVIVALAVFYTVLNVAVAVLNI